MKDVVVIKTKCAKWFIVLIVLVLLFTSCASSNKKYVDIYNVVKEAYLTDKGYSAELSKHMSEEVFKSINIYNDYGFNDPEYKKPFKVDFSLKENSQSKKNNIVYVKMTYSLEIRDSLNELAGGAGDIPITFTVKKTGNEWYIIDKYERP